MTIQTKRHKKLYYPAGLISLILLPILGTWLLNTYTASENLRVIEINMWTRDWNKYLPDEYPFKLYPERNYVYININRNDQDNTIKLVAAKLGIKKLINTHDTINGIHFHFDSQSKYGTFIYILNTLIKEKARQYVMKDDDIWVFNFDPKPRKDKPKEYLISCGTHDMIDYGSYDELDNRMEKQQQEKVVSTLKLFWFQGILLVMMAAFSMSKIRKLRIPVNNK